jgi:hypothetical protein
MLRIRVEPALPNHAPQHLPGRHAVVDPRGALQKQNAFSAAGWKLVQLKDHLKVHLLGKAGGAQAENAFSEEGRAELCGRGQEVQVQVK